MEKYSETYKIKKDEEETPFYDVNVFVILKSIA